MLPKTTSRRIGVVIYPNAQTLDVTGPHEVFAMASTLLKQQSSNGYEVFLIAESLEPVVMTSGMRLQPDYRFEDCPLPLDTLVVPASFQPHGATRFQGHGAREAD